MNLAKHRERTKGAERAILTERTRVVERAINCERTSMEERAISRDRTKAIERTWFDVWQSKRIAARSNRKQFEIIRNLQSLGQKERENQPG